jgi:hypothetical protein
MGGGMTRAAVCLLAATLAGCGGDPATRPAVYSYVPAGTEMPKQEQAPVAPEESPAVRAPTVAPAAPAASASASLPQNAALASIGAPENPKAARLVGKSGAELEQLFGPAQFVRAEKAAEMRQYRASTCVLDLFLYLDSKTGAQRVEHAAIRAREGAKPDEAGCLKSLLTAHWLPST